MTAALQVEHDLPNLELLGVGTNLGCYGSIQATPEKMHDLVAAAEQVEKALSLIHIWWPISPPTAS